MNDRLYTITEIKEHITPIAQQYGLDKVYLFGSYARGEAKPDSDIDLCIEKGRLRTLFELSGFCVDIEDALKKQVDVDHRRD
ncbi:MAG: nucleotidyltransferase domain-containing protein [Treponema sp.]|jgi:predicted nucleotidyltransferase|nr:nucleotidyltransferase domain-containing protein [Treponema sp.]